jgi:hypothetical protein
MDANFAGLCENVNNFSKDRIFASNSVQNCQIFQYVSIFAMDIIMVDTIFDTEDLY